MIQTTAIGALKQAYSNATGRLIPFLTQTHACQTNVRMSAVNKIFDHPAWKAHNMSSGHKKFTHIVTQQVVEYAGHDKDLDLGALKRLRTTIQDIVNQLGNDIFNFKTFNWKTEPNWKESEKRFIARARR